MSETVINWRLSPEEIRRRPLVTCSECGDYVDEDGTAFGAGDTIVWARCSSCVAEWVKENAPAKIGVERAYRLVADAELPCSECGKLIEPKGPVRVFIRPTGELAKCFCGRCVVAHIERGKIETAKAHLLARIGPAGRSKGMLFRQVMREESTQLDVLREAADELVDDGKLVLIKSMLRVPVSHRVIVTNELCEFCSSDAAWISESEEARIATCEKHVESMPGTRIRVVRMSPTMPLRGLWSGGVRTTDAPKAAQATIFDDL